MTWFTPFKRKSDIGRRMIIKQIQCIDRCQLGFQYPIKWEIGKKWGKNYIVAVAKLGKLTPSVSQEKMSAKKNSPRFMVSRLEDQTCHPCNPHFGWWPLKMKWGLQWRTKWGLHGWHECRATGALGEAGKSSLVSGGAEMWRNSISYHPALYIANCLFWKARKKNFQLFRALKPQPTSWVGWGTWLGIELHWTAMLE